MNTPAFEGEICPKDKAAAAWPPTFYSPQCSIKKKAISLRRSGTAFIQVTAPEGIRAVAAPCGAVR